MAPLLCGSSVDICLLMGLPPPGAGPFPQSYPSSVMVGLVHHSSTEASQCTLTVIGPGLSWTPYEVAPTNPSIHVCGNTLIAVSPTSAPAAPLVRA